MKKTNIPVGKRKSMIRHKCIQAIEIYTHVTGSDTIDAGRALSEYKPARY